MGDPRTGHFTVQPLRLSGVASRLLRPRHRATRLLPAVSVLQELPVVQGAAAALRAAIEQGTGNGILDVRDEDALLAVASHLVAICADNQKVTG